MCAPLEAIVEAAGKKVGARHVAQVVIVPSSGDQAWCYQVQVDAR
jgi:hypothetical protein